MLTSGSLTVRATSALILLVFFLISAWFRRRADHEGGEVPRSEDPAPIHWTIRGLWLVLVASLVLYLAVPGWVGPVVLEHPTWLRIGGLALAGLDLGLVVWTLGSLGSNITATSITREEHELVTHGPYRWVRHPLYTSGTILWISVWAFSGLLIFLAIMVASLSVVLWRLPREEAELEERFGETYLSYKERTGALLPRVR